MPRAWCQIRNLPSYRAEAFRAGLEAAGFRVTDSGLSIGFGEPGDLLVIWNRYGVMDRAAAAFKARGGRVLVAENGYLGRDWRGGHWYALAENYHNGAGTWPYDGPERWDRWGVEIQPWLMGPREILGLATRHIGPEGVREPPGWITGAAARLERASRLRVRIRRHPGENPATPLEADLARAGGVLTWGSSAALKALLAGWPAIYGFSRWIGAPAGLMLDDAMQLSGPAILEAAMLGDRLGMFRRLAWAMWNTDEIRAGAPFRWLTQ